MNERARSTSCQETLAGWKLPFHGVVSDFSGGNGPIAPLHVACIETGYCLVTYQALAAL